MCAFKGTPRLPKDAPSAFAQLFAPQMTPLSYARDWHSNGRDIVAKRRWKGDTLVVYAYHETPDAKANMAYFLKHGLRTDGSCGYRGQRALFTEIPQDSDRFKNTLRIIRRDNSCFDFGS